MPGAKNSVSHALQRSARRQPQCSSRPVSIQGRGGTPSQPCFTKLHETILRSQHARRLRIERVRGVALEEKEEQTGWSAVINPEIADTCAKATTCMYVFSYSIPILLRRAERKPSQNQAMQYVHKQMIHSTPSIPRNAIHCRFIHRAGEIR